MIHFLYYLQQFFILPLLSNFAVSIEGNWKFWCRFQPYLEAQPAAAPCLILHLILSTIPAVRLLLVFLLRIQQGHRQLSQLGRQAHSKKKKLYLNTI
jgi:hypothetical protein